MYMVWLYIDVAVTIRYSLIKKWINKHCYSTVAVEKNTIYLYSIQHFIFDIVQQKTKHHKKHLKQAPTP